MAKDYDIKPEKASRAVAIVGRPNVGKSALFNRVIRRKMAIVHEESGVTRDRVTSVVEHEDYRFTLIDTGGLGLYHGEKSDNDWDELIKEQLMVALESAEQVIFVLDITTGVTPLDKEVAQLLRETKDVKVHLVANKADEHSTFDNADVFAELGLGQARPVSSIQNIGVQEMLDDIVSFWPKPEFSEAEDRLKVAIVGRPNVGKSSIINRLLGEERVIVSEIAGTTRDAVDVPVSITIGEKVIQMDLVDTAGIKRKGKVDNAVDFFSMSRTENAIKRADICIIVLDAFDLGTAMDKRICRMVLDHGKPSIILFNKWDLAEEDGKEQEGLLENADYQLPFMKFAERMFCCAKTGYNCEQIIPQLIDMTITLSQEFPTSLVNRVVQDALMRLPPPFHSTGQFKVYYGTCKSSRPPTFLLFVNEKKRCSGNYLSYLEHQFMNAFSIKGMPVRLILQNRRQKDNTRVTPSGVAGKKDIEARTSKSNKKKYGSSKRRKK
ncbi:MAG: ribosome biogenesis GTPase Der [Lentisphaeria bacterium]|nr:ribosome biogenesis GTPase Der [Lentisphaeria bacterium]NQZ68434.1 ribosome biogenesis GTPase Der [Lentisphaeria bacterium]